LDFHSSYQSFFLSASPAAATSVFASFGWESGGVDAVTGFGFQNKLMTG